MLLPNKFVAVTMLYLELLKQHPTAGSLAAVIKEQLLDTMVFKRKGLLEAADIVGVHPARVLVEYKADKLFAQAVDLAREVLAERVDEELLQLSNEAVDRETAAAKALQIRVRTDIRNSLLKRYRLTSAGKDTKEGDKHLHLHQHQEVTLPPEEQQRLIEQRDRLIATSSPSKKAQVVESERVTSITSDNKDHIKSDEQPVE